MASWPLRYRLRAWWEGYDLAELQRRIDRPAAEEPARPQSAPVQVTRPPLERRRARTETANSPGWTSATLAAAQIVWGQKSLSPRGEDALKALAGLTRLGPDSRILHIGAELGGVAALLARGLGCKVVPVETLAALANASSGSVSLVRPGDPVLMPDADLILVDNLAERSDPLAAILRNQVSGLKPGGAVVLRSLVLSEPRAAVSARYREWAAGEPIRPRLRSAEDLTRLLHEARLSVQSSTSIADTYAADVEEHWRAALDRIRALHEDASGRALAPAVLGECERWLKRIELLREGVIGFRRFIAYRRELRR